MNQIYAYVDGSDLHDVEALLLPQLADFISAWGIPSATIVNDKLPRTSDLRNQDLPDWNMGLNFEVETFSADKMGELLIFLANAAASIKREFVIGVWYQNEGISEDLCFVDSEVDPESLPLLASVLN